MQTTGDDSNLIEARVSRPEKGGVKELFTQGPFPSPASSFMASMLSPLEGKPVYWSFSKYR